MQFSSIDSTYIWARSSFELRKLEGSFSGQTLQNIPESSMLETWLRIFIPLQSVGDYTELKIICMNSLDMPDRY